MGQKQFDRVALIKMGQKQFDRVAFPEFPLTHCRLNKLPHTIYWKILILILGMSGYVI